MYFRSLVVALAIFGLTVAAPGRFEGLRQARRERRDNNRRLNYLTSTGLEKLESIGFGSQSGVPASGVNAASSGTEGVWIGDNGPYTVNYVNNSPDEVVLVVWGSQPPYQASFVTAVQPLITISLEGGGDTATLSFANEQSGAWAGVYQDTTLTSNGQIGNTWGEFTMSPSGVVDISQEVYTQGNSMTIVGPDCTANMDTCAFQCYDTSASSCGTSGSYHIVNCAPGSQPGAQSGADATTGGCGWLGATGVNLQATFS